MLNNFEPHIFYFIDTGGGGDFTSWPPSIVVDPPVVIVDPPVTLPDIPDYPDPYIPDNPDPYVPDDPDTPQIYPPVCLLAGTKILTNNGPCNIELLIVGTVVESYNTVTKEKTTSEIISIFEHESEEYLVINNELYITSEHPLFSDNDWKKAGSLVIGDIVETVNGFTEIVSVENVTEKVTVYNIEVSPEHTYYANNYLVHNKGGGGGGGGGTTVTKTVVAVDEKVKASSTDTTGFLDSKVAGSLAIITNKLKLLGEDVRPAAHNKFYGQVGGLHGFFVPPGSPYGADGAVQVSKSGRMFGDSDYFYYLDGICNLKSELTIKGGTQDAVTAVTTTNFTLNNPGSGYAVGDILTIVQPGGTDATVIVTSVSEVVTIPVLPDNPDKPYIADQPGLPEIIIDTDPLFPPTPEWPPIPLDYDYDLPFPPGAACFAAGTSISISNGFKFIEDICVGDDVISYDEDLEIKAISTVTKTFKHTSDRYLVINDYLKVTPNHPIFLDGIWVNAEDLVIGDILSGEYLSVEIESIVSVDEETETFNLEVEPNHTYYADGILVHNKMPPPPIPDGAITPPVPPVSRDPRILYYGPPTENGLVPQFDAIRGAGDMPMPPPIKPPIPDLPPDYYMPPSFPPDPPEDLGDFDRPVFPPVPDIGNPFDDTLFWARGPEDLPGNDDSSIVTTPLIDQTRPFIYPPPPTTPDTQLGGKILTFDVITEGTGYTSGKDNPTTTEGLGTGATIDVEISSTFGRLAFDKEPKLCLLSKSTTSSTSFMLSASQEAEHLIYTLPTDYPEDDDYVLSAKKTGTMSWIEATGGGACIYKKDANINVNRNDINTWFDASTSLINRIDPATLVWQSNTGYTTISGGLNNQANRTLFDFIGGGVCNKIGYDALVDPVPGDYPTGCVIVGGGYNYIIGHTINHNGASFATICGGSTNKIKISDSSFIGGGYNNEIYAATGSAIVGGTANVISPTIGSSYCFIGAGSTNTITDKSFSVIGGGQLNTSKGGHAFLGGGYSNSIGGTAGDVICGGSNNSTVSTYSGIGCNSILGGKLNVMSSTGDYNTILAGYGNTITGNGGNNTVFGTNATTAFANTLVWSDSTAGGSDRNQQAVFYAHGGFKIHTGAGDFEFVGNPGTAGAQHDKWFVTPEADCYLDNTGVWYVKNLGAVSASNITANLSIGAGLSIDGNGDLIADGGWLTTVDISTDTNLATSAPIVLTGDTLSIEGSRTSDSLLTTTGSTSIATHTPSVQGNFVAYIYYRVITSTTDVTVTVTYTDGTGAQTNTVLSAQSSPVGSYSCVPVFINATTSAISVNATAGTANQVYVSASIVGI